MGGVSEEERGFTALLEQIRREVATVADGIAGLHEKTDRISEESAKRAVSLDQKIDLFAVTLNKKFDRLSSQIQNHIGRAHSS